MDLLFLSQRIYLGDGSHETPLNGGIIVDTGGIIRRGKWAKLKAFHDTQPFDYYEYLFISYYIQIYIGSWMFVLHLLGFIQF